LSIASVSALQFAIPAAERAGNLTRVDRSGCCVVDAHASRQAELRSFGGFQIGLHTQIRLQSCSRPYPWIDAAQVGVNRLQRRH